MAPALHRANPPPDGEPPWRVRIAVALTTRPIPPEFTANPLLNAYLRQLKAAGWSLREAYYRNWVIWRHGGANPGGLIVFPADRIAGDDDFALFIAVETLLRTGHPEPFDDRANLEALCPTVARLAVPELLNRYRRAEQLLLRLRWWR